MHLAVFLSDQGELSLSSPSSFMLFQLPLPLLKSARILSIRAVFCFTAGARSSCCPRLHRRHPPAASPALPVAGLLGGVNFPLCDGKSPRNACSGSYCGLCGEFISSIGEFSLHRFSVAIP